MNLHESDILILYAIDSISHKSMEIVSTHKSKCDFFLSFLLLVHYFCIEFLVNRKLFGNSRNTCNI